jgi:hypothetical protein
MMKFGACWSQIWCVGIGFGAAGVGVVVTDLWLQICF